MSTHVCEEENNVHKMNEEEHALTFNNTPPQQPYVNKHAQHASITIEGPYVQQHQQPHAMQHALETIEHLQQEGHATRNTTTPTPPLQSEYVWTFSPTTTGACMLDTFSTTHNHSQSKINVTKKEMERYFGASQALAARLLGVSVSTLKRRFKESYEVQFHRWPYHKLTNLEKRHSLWFYINDENEDEKFISSKCEQVLEKAFENCTLPLEHYFSELKPKPRKKDFTFLNYIPQHEMSSHAATTSELSMREPRLKGGSKQLYQIMEDCK
ncbi:hypothetical protein FDP41_003365 [Naegleria fowleri]|uniref:RWP-RK domain-containing protein n=1 Tax=Naegleria fowleri TaxID=5763 RepID=A0A6A5BHN4_NAEFO|nr:uncharacterized protein FDP41_003365 [Naegleria fowleri]KAF0977373.1 hypothetical protein FDP41_003365 [Naegleria fowleri]